MNDEDVAPGSVPPLKYMQDRHKKNLMFWEELVRSKLKKKEKEKKRGDVDEDTLSDQERVLLLYYA